MSGYKDFELEVNEFKKYVQSERLKQYDIYSSSANTCREGERQKLVALNNINTSPQTKEELDYLTLIVQDIVELDASKIRIEGNQSKTHKITDKPKKDHYIRDFLLANFLPPLLISFLPIIIAILSLIHGNCFIFNQCLLCKFVSTDFFGIWCFSPIITGPLVMIIIMLCVKAVNKKYNKETDPVTKGALIAGIIGCAISSVKNVKSGVKNLLNQDMNNKV